MMPLLSTYIGMFTIGFLFTFNAHANTINHRHFDSITRYDEFTSKLQVCVWHAYCKLCEIYVPQKLLHIYSLYKASMYSYVVLCCYHINTYFFHSLSNSSSVMLSCKDDSIFRNSGLITVFGGPLVAAEGKMSDSVSTLCNDNKLCTHMCPTKLKGL